MYKLFLKGVRDPTIIDQNDYDTYLEAKKLHESGENVKSIELSVGSIPLEDVRSILKVEGESKESKGIFGLTTEELKKVLGDFRQQWRDACPSCRGEWRPFFP